MSASVYDALKTPRPPQLGAEDDLRFDETLTARARAEGDLEACCYRRDYPMIYEGRPLRWRGQMLLPELRVEPARRVEAEERPRGIDWSASARHEHASSASFLRLALDLVALGAPRALVREAWIAARQELDHASLALRLAAADGAHAALGAMSVPAELNDEAGAVRVERLARELLLDAALGEGLAALEATERARYLEGNFRAEMLVLAEEETGHALFGWRVLRWLVSARSDLLALFGAWLEEAAGAADTSGRAMIEEVMWPALRSMEAGVATQRQGVRHLPG